MKSFILAACILIISTANASYVPSQVPVAGHAQYNAPSPNVPCPKSVVVSCAPTVQTVPCRNTGYAPTLGATHGAYTENVPQYTALNSPVAVAEDWSAAQPQYTNQYAAQPQYAQYPSY